MTDHLSAAGAPVRELPDGLVEVDALDIGEGDQPGENVGELTLFGLVRFLADGRGQFADFLHKP